MKTKVKMEVDMSNKKRSSTSKAREARTDSYRNRFEKNHVKARNPWPDPFSSSRRTRVHRANKETTTVRSGDNSRQSRSKSDNQNKTRN